MVKDTILDHHDVITDLLQSTKSEAATVFSEVALFVANTEKVIMVAKQTLSLQEYVTQVEGSLDKSAAEYTIYELSKEKENLVKTQQSLVSQKYVYEQLSQRGYNINVFQLCLQQKFLVVTPLHIIFVTTTSRYHY